jgi:hypothetical protein
MKLSSQNKIHCFGKFQEYSPLGFPSATVDKSWRNP